MESGTFRNTTEFHVLVGLGVRLTGVGFSGQNSVVESRTFPTYITELYVLVGGISQERIYGRIRTQLGTIFPVYIKKILRCCRSKTDGGGILRTEFCDGISPQPGLSYLPPI